MRPRCWSQQITSHAADFACLRITLRSHSDVRYAVSDWSLCGRWQWRLRVRLRSSIALSAPYGQSLLELIL